MVPEQARSEVARGKPPRQRGRPLVYLYSLAGIAEVYILRLRRERL